jgi:hypothetical protein
VSSPKNALRVFPLTNFDELQKTIQRLSGISLVDLDLFPPPILAVFLSFHWFLMVRSGAFLPHAYLIVDPCQRPPLKHTDQSFFIHDHGPFSRSLHSQSLGVGTPGSGGDDIQEIKLHLQEKKWLTTGLIDEITALFPTAGDVSQSPQTGEHDKAKFVENCHELFVQ